MSQFNWVGYGKFPDKAPFCWGNVQASDAHEARLMLGELWAKHFHIDPPDFEPQRGILFFLPEK